MPKGPFEGPSFIPTEFSTADEKAAFGNTFLRFVRSEWKRTLFTKKFYNRLSMTFGNIAHYNIHGFYSTWFERNEDRLAFLENTLRYPCYGQPEFTYCDVERAIQIELRKLNLIAVYRQRIEAEVRSREISELARLQKKYGAIPTSTIPIVTSEPGSPGGLQLKQSAPPSSPVSSTPIQGTLF